MPDASQCPHCGDKRMTKGRYMLNLFVYIPMAAMVAGLFLYYAFAASSPEVTIAWLPGIILFTYVIGGLWARSQRETVRTQAKQAEQADAAGE
jgi:hypothetical protein